MIYWSYIKAQQEPETVTVPDPSFDERDVTDEVGAAVTAGKAVATGVFLYFAAKWIVASLLASTTGGFSFGAAACMP